MYRFVFLSFLISGAVGQVIKPGLCDYAAIGGFVSDLNITGMFGTWNQLARIDNTLETGQCSSLSIHGDYDANGALTSVHAHWYEVVNQTKTSYNGTLAAVASINGLFYANLTGLLEGFFVVQATNYTDYAILYSCVTHTVANAEQNTVDTKAVMAWQYHKNTELSDTEKASIEAIVKLNPDLNGTEWKQISHTKAACGNAGVSLAVPPILILLATLFIGKEFV